MLQSSAVLGNGFVQPACHGRGAVLGVHFVPPTPLSVHTSNDNPNYNAESQGGAAAAKIETVVQTEVKVLDVVFIS